MSSLESNIDVKKWLEQDVSLPETTRKQNQIKAYLVRDKFYITQNSYSILDIIEKYALKIGWISTKENIEKQKHTKFIEYIKNQINKKTESIPETSLRKLWTDFQIEYDSNIIYQDKFILLDQRWKKIYQQYDTNGIEDTYINNTKTQTDINNSYLLLKNFYNLCSLHELDIIGW